MKITVSGYYGFHNTGDEAIALAISRELTPTPFEELIFAPPTRKKSYGQFNGGCTPKMAFKQADETSRDPPLVL